MCAAKLSLARKCFIPTDTARSLLTARAKTTPRIFLPGARRDARSSRAPVVSAFDAREKSLSLEDASLRGVSRGLAPRATPAASTPVGSYPFGGAPPLPPSRAASSTAHWGIAYRRLGQYRFCDNLSSTSRWRTRSGALPVPCFGGRSNHVAIELQDVPEGERVGMGDVEPSGAHSKHWSNSPFVGAGLAAAWTFGSTTVTTTRLPTSVSDILYRASRRAFA